MAVGVERKRDGGVAQQLADHLGVDALGQQDGPGGYWVAELLRQVRAAETVDPEGRQWPRTKRSDDATAVYLVLSDG